VDRTPVTRLTRAPVQAGSDPIVTAAGLNNVPANAAGVDPLPREPARMPVGAGGAIDLSVSRGQSDLVLDVAGYFTPLGG